MIVRNVHRVGPMVKGVQCCRDCGMLIRALHADGWRIGTYLELRPDGHSVKQWRNPPPARRRCNAEPD